MYKSVLPIESDPPVIKTSKIAPLYFAESCLQIFRIWPNRKSHRKGRHSHHKNWAKIVQVSAKRNCVTLLKNCESKQFLSPCPTSCLESRSISNQIPMLHGSQVYQIRSLCSRDCQENIRVPRLKTTYTQVPNPERQITNSTRSSKGRQIG